MNQGTSKIEFSTLPLHQRKIMHLIFQGKTTNDILFTLDLAPKTLLSKKRIIREQLGVTTLISQEIKEAREQFYSTLGKLEQNEISGNYDDFVFDDVEQGYDELIDLHKIIIYQLGAGNSKQKIKGDLNVAFSAITTAKSKLKKVFGTTDYDKAIGLYNNIILPEDGIEDEVLQLLQGRGNDILF